MRGPWSVKQAGTSGNPKVNSQTHRSAQGRHSFLEVILAMGDPPVNATITAETGREPRLATGAIAAALVKSINCRMERLNGKFELIPCSFIDDTV